MYFFSSIACRVFRKNEMKNEKKKISNFLLCPPLPPPPPINLFEFSAMIPTKYHGIKENICGSRSFSSVKPMTLALGFT
jgi:hypothetical protein